MIIENKMPHLIKLIQKRVANVAIGPTTLRNQGASGVTKKTREYFADLDLRRFKGISEAEFTRQLNICTGELRRKLPKKAKHWGTARKALNLFLMEAFYNRFLSKKYGLHSLEAYLEVPLDNQVVTGLKECAEKGALPRWKGIKGLENDDSDKFQCYAQKLTKDKKLGSRVYLDLILWRREKHLCHN